MTVKEALLTESPACSIFRLLASLSYIMPALNELEKAVLEQMLRQTSGNLLPLLKEQIEGVSVVSRKNTGAGFFTELKAKQISKPIEANVIQDVCADIEGFDQSMLFLLFLHDGVIHTLEGATIDDSTVDVDFSNVRFVIRPCCSAFAKYRARKAGFAGL